MLKPPCLDDLALINLTDRIVRYKARFVGALRPWLLVVHDVRDFIVVRARAVLFDVITPRAERLGFIGRQNRGVMMDDRVIVQLAFVADRRPREAFETRRS